MAAPFDYSEVSSKAERLADELWQTGDYRDDTWRDPVLGPLARVDLLLRHRPGDAFDEPVTPDYLAECRTYAAVYLAAVYDGLARANTADDVFIDLATEFDSLPSADVIGAMEAAKADAKAELARLKQSGKATKAKPPGSIRKFR